MQFSAFCPVVVDISVGSNQELADEISRAMEAAYHAAMDRIVKGVTDRGAEINHKLEPVIQGMFIVPATAEGKYICTICLTAGARDITVEQMMHQQQMQQQQAAQRGIMVPQVRGMKPNRR